MSDNFSNHNIINDNVSRTWIKIEFSLFLIGQIVSIPCYIFVLYHFLAHKITRRALHNHVIIILLIYNFIDLTVDLSLTMTYSLFDIVSPFSPIICLLWQFIDYGIWYGTISLMFWASVERHILVFHSNIIRTKQRRIILHYIPLLFFSLYTPILYFYLIFLYPCDHIFLSTHVRCGSLCYFYLAPIWFIYYDTLAHYTIPILLITLFSSILILRFIKQKSRLKQAIKWRQCRKMIIQLSLIFLSTHVRCGSLCYFYLAPIWFIYYDTLAHYTIPILLITLFSSILILRFIKQKSRLKQAIKWRQCRKMIIQLSLVSISYLVFDLPYIIIIIVQSSGYPNFGSEIITPYISHLVYVPPIVVPYATLLSLPRLKHKLRSLLIWKRNRRIIAPITVVQ
ncbi:unnamed protein product [Adineta steineri]|uniref:G-protein coupled receptors family 1 profile domain-containing protein n=1 Tax=Adineta steineri TaxID=433720 RepID=A0A814FYG0_9BILA|nr:unnamed protein product [Adineta steineri]